MTSRPRTGVGTSVAVWVAVATAVATSTGCNAVSSRFRPPAGLPDATPKSPPAAARPAPVAMPPGGESLPPVETTSAELPRPAETPRPVAAPPIPGAIEPSGVREPAPLKIDAPALPPAEPRTSPGTVIPTARTEPVGPKDEQVQAVVLEAITQPEPVKKPEPPRVEIPAPEPPTKPQPAPAPEPPPSPERAWRETLDKLRTLARARAAEVPASVDPLWPLRTRLLNWMAEAAEPRDWIATDGRDHGRLMLEAFRLVAAEPKPQDVKPNSSDAGLLREAVRALEARVPFEITELALCRKVNGFGDFETMAPPTRSPGQPVVIYAELEGLTFEPMETGFRSRLASRVELVSDLARPPVWSQDLGTAEDRCRRRRRDFYVNNRFSLPENLKPGEYRLRLIQTDLVSSKSAVREVPITINP